MQRSHPDTELWHTAASMIADGTGEFKKFFYRKSVLAIAYHVTIDLMKSQGFSRRTTEYTRDGVYLGILMLQGSLHTSGSAYCITTMMEYLRYSDDEAYWGGFAASIAAGLAVDSTRWGVLKIALSVVAGMAGRQSVSTLYQNGKTLFSNCKSWLWGGQPEESADTAESSVKFPSLYT